MKVLRTPAKLTPNIWHTKAHTNIYIYIYNFNKTFTKILYSDRHIHLYEEINI